MLSQRALSWHLPPALFMLCLMPYWQAASRYFWLVYWLPLSLWMTAPRMSGWALMAFSSVCTHSGAFMFVSIASPTTLASKQSKIAETYSFPLLAFISVISVTHLDNVFLPGNPVLVDPLVFWLPGLLSWSHSVCAWDDGWSRFPPWYGKPCVRWEYLCFRDVSRLMPGTSGCVRKCHYIRPP